MGKRPLLVSLFPLLLDRTPPNTQTVINIIATNDAAKAVYGNALSLQGRIQREETNELPNNFPVPIYANYLTSEQSFSSYLPEAKHFEQGAYHFITLRGGGFRRLSA